MSQPSCHANTHAELVSVEKIWDAAPHNAFTDLIYWKQVWYCVFREGRDHVSPDGALRILASSDGRHWESAARITMDGVDLRDAKITATPDGQLMLMGAGAYPPGGKVRHQTFMWISKDGRAWSEAEAVGDPDVWLWRVRWVGETAWGIGYSTRSDDRFTRWYKSDNGAQFVPVISRLDVAGYANEHDFAELANGRLVCLLRRDENPGTAMIGVSDPPYDAWEWKDAGQRVGGPAILRIPDGRLLAAVRLYDGKVRTSLAWLDPDKGTLKEFLTLPSAGDTSYPGLVWNTETNELWISYYSSHEAKTSIYLARVKVGKE